MAELAAGYAPVVASGHFHVNQDRAEDGTLFLQVGTTGGAGPTGFTPEGDVPFSAEILYFRASADGTNRLIAWDVIQELPATGSFVRRHVVATDYGSLSPSPPRSRHRARRRCHRPFRSSDDVRRRGPSPTVLWPSTPSSARTKMAPAEVIAMGTKMDVRPHQDSTAGISG
jgi:hypothetical protein